MFSNFGQYHEALKEFIQKAFVSGSVILEPVDTAFDYAIKQTKGDLKFPFISIYPAPTTNIEIANNNFAAYKEGTTFYKEVPVYNDDGSLKGKSKKISKNVKNLYINIEYQIDVWALDRKTAEEVMQELLFLLYDNQQLTIVYQTQELHFTFHIGDAIQDNTELVQYEQRNKLYRYTLGIGLQATLLRSENYFNVIDPIVNLELINKEEN